MANILFITITSNPSASENSLITFWEDGGNNTVAQISSVAGDTPVIDAIDAADFTILGPTVNNTSPAIEAHLLALTKPILTYHATQAQVELKLCSGTGSPTISACLVNDASPLIGTLEAANNPHSFWTGSTAGRTLDTIAAGMVWGAKHTSGSDRTLVGHIPSGGTLADATTAAGLRVYFNWAESSTILTSDLAADGTELHEATRAYMISESASADIADVIYSDAGQSVPVASTTFDYWIVDADSPDGTVTTDGSGNFSIPAGTLTAGNKVMITRNQSATDDLSVEAHTVA